MSAARGLVAVVYCGYPHRGTGVAQHLRQLQRALPALGYACDVISLQQVTPGARLLPHAVQLAINAVRPPFGFYRRYRVGRSLLRSALRTCMRRHQVSGVLFEDIFTAFPVPVASAAVLHALQSHNLQTLRLSEARVAEARRYEAACLEQVPCPVLTVSAAYRDAVVRDLGSFLRRRPTLEVIPLGVDTTAFPFPPTPRRSDRLELVFLGYLEARKNVVFLAELAAALAARAVSFHLTVIGDGPQREELRSWFAARDQLACVTLVGRLPHRDVPVALQRFHVMVHPTLVESFAHTLLEGRLAGLWTIASEGLTIPPEFADASLPLDVGAWADHLAAHAAKYREPPSDERLHAIRELALRFGAEEMARRYLARLGLS